MTKEEIEEREKTDQIWCEEGGRMLRLTIVENNKLKIETLCTIQGWPGIAIDTVTMARFRLQRIKAIIDKALEDKK